MIAPDPISPKRKSSVEAKLERDAFLGKAISLKNEAQGMATSALGKKVRSGRCSPTGSDPGEMRSGHG